MSNYPSPLITDRWADFEKRLARLEAVLGSGVLGSDQTIKGSHDRLDALLGAGVASANLVSGVRVGTNTILATITKTGIADNVNTPIFTVTTANEAGSTDGGAWTAHVLALCSHSAANDTTDAAVRVDHFSIAHVNKADGTAVTAVDDLHTSSVAATSAGTRTVSFITPGYTATSNYVTTMNLQIDLGGSGVGDAQAVCFVVLEWTGYLTAPVIAAA